MLRLVTIAMTCSTLASLWKFQYFRRPIYNPVEYGCSFFAKLSWKKNVVFEKIFVFYKKYIICRRKCFYMGKKFYIKKYFSWKKTFFTEKNINENVKKIYLIWKIYFYTENVCAAYKI